MFVAVLALAVPIGAGASAGGGKNTDPFAGKAAALAAVAGNAAAKSEAKAAVKATAAPQVAGWPGKGQPTGFVEPFLEDLATANPGAEIPVIVYSTRGHGAAKKVLEQTGFDGGGGKELSLVGGRALTLTGAAILQLAKVESLRIVYDAPVRGANAVNTQLWPHESGNARLWQGDANHFAGKLPAIAIVDSGIDAGRADFRGRVVADVKLSTLPDEPGDSRGHGTFVAGIAAGAAMGYAGAAPTAPIVSLDVMNRQGMAMVSDVIRACQWILDNKDTYNIRVANFSLHAARPSSINWDPLAFAVRRLWLKGVVVVAASGNYGVEGGPSGVHHAPGNDPFIITVGALDIGKGAAVVDDSIAYWSAYGYTYDGFAKPEIVASGRYMVGPVPMTATLPLERPDRVVAPGYMQLSGTSFSAPVVAGSAAQLLARNPHWGPDEVKGALMLTARPVPGGAPLQSGVGQITVPAAALVKAPPNPNAGLNQFLVTDEATGERIFDTAAWGSAAWNSAAWNSAAWNSAAWSSAAWNSAAWSSAAWNSAAWNSAAWSSAAWAGSAWADVAFEDNAARDLSSDEYLLTAEEELALLSDPDLEFSEPLLADAADTAGGVVEPVATATNEPVAAATSTTTTTTTSATTTTTTTTSTTTSTVKGLTP